MVFGLPGSLLKMRCLRKEKKSLLLGFFLLLAWPCHRFRFRFFFCWFRPYFHCDLIVGKNSWNWISVQHTKWNRHHTHTHTDKRNRIRIVKMCRQNIFLFCFVLFSALVITNSVVVVVVDNPVKMQERERERRKGYWFSIYVFGCPDSISVIIIDHEILLLFSANNFLFLLVFCTTTTTTNT